YLVRKALEAGAGGVIVPHVHDRKDAEAIVLAAKFPPFGKRGYGGLCLRPDSKRKPMHFTAAAGKIEKDVLELASPWADVSIAVEKGSEKLSGLAVFQHPSLPGYPHPGWIMRNYGFLGQSWPHTTPYDLEPGKFFTLKYRVVIHRGSAEDAGIEKLHEAYVRSEGGDAK
ncbi:MAG TPA: PmoA family protein, partial [Candidatus Hydrogenedentes bacterium]|nr:PmoA family protein [Candidatus Hydrogenedentota bacterium]